MPREVFWSIAAHERLSLVRRQHLWVLEMPGTLLCILGVHSQGPVESCTAGLHGVAGRGHYSALMNHHCSYRYLPSVTRLQTDDTIQYLTYPAGGIGDHGKITARILHERPRE